MDIKNKDYEHLQRGLLCHKNSAESKSFVHRFLLYTLSYYICLSIVSSRGDSTFTEAGLKTYKLKLLNVFGNADVHVIDKRTRSHYLNVHTSPCPLSVPCYLQPPLLERAYCLLFYTCIHDPLSCVILQSLLERTYCILSPVLFERE